MVAYAAESQPTKPTLDGTTFMLTLNKIKNIMKRKIFLVKGLSNDPDELKMDKYFIDSYYALFNMNAGGAYESDEIVILNEPSSSQLNNELRKEELDYGILVYIGHGASQDNNQLFQLNQDEIIKAGQFYINAPKQIVIVESCRTKVDSVFAVDLKDYVPKFKYGGTVRYPLSREIARHVYDCHIMRCKDGMMVGLACSPGENAYNYYFSTLILQNTIEWHQETHRHCAIFPIDDVMGLALFHTIELARVNINKVQKPQRIGIINFPFAVSKC